jgi:hypothetical protein
MRIVFYLLFFFSFSKLTYCQENIRGVKLDQITSNRETKGETYALIVGISNYKDSKIPQLKYADVDAIAFQKYLLETGVKNENIYTLINDQATNAAFWSLLNYISDKAKNGDIVYIYFSGHGDVETKTIVKDAYLLPYDSPSSVYCMGAIGVMSLKSWLATFASNGIQTIFIADACKSGNLIGGREGMDAAANILKDKWQDEIKMVSCQPGELSLESEKWGGGRGLFSYELINGLSGKADKNNDKNISLRELKLYLIEKVPEQAGINKQNPELYGNLELTISTANEEIFDINQKVKLDPSEISININSNENNSIKLNENNVNSRSVSNNLIEKADTSNVRHYRNFVEQLKQNIIFDFGSPSAYKSYCSLSNSEIKESAKVILCNKLMEDIRQLTTWVLQGSSRSNKGFDLFKISFEGTILREILGDKKLKESGIYSQVLFTECCRSIIHSSTNKYEMPKQLAIFKLDSALSFDPSAVYINCLKGFIYHKEFNNREKALNEYKAALTGNPNFGIAKELLLLEFIEKNDLLELYESRVLNHCYSPLKPELEYKRNNEVGEWLISAKESKKAINYFEKSLISLLEFMGEDYYKKLTNNDFFDNNLEISLESEYQNLHYKLACCYALNNLTKNALEHIESALDGGYNDFDHMQSDSDLASLQKNKKFQQLIKKKKKQIKKNSKQ